VASLGYDTENNLTSIQDANGHTTTFNYDAFGRVSRTNFPSGYIETYGYDAVGNLTSKTDRKNQLVTYTYDQLNRLTQKAYPDSTAVNYTYDNDSRLTQVTDPTGTYQFAFDNMGRLTATTTSYAFLAGRNFTTSYGYDAASNRTGFTDPESGATSYVYDTLNRLQTLTLPAAFVAGPPNSFGFSYDALSRRTQMTRPNGLKSVYAYDNLSRLQSVLHQSGSTTLDGAAYAVDNAGNRTSRTPQPSGTASNHAYDNLYQLTGVTQNSITTESYTYDPVGNRLSSLGVSPYTNNSSNELTSIPGTTYTYDNNGNTQTKVVGSDTTSYAWDFENRLTSVTLPASGGTVTFKYDSLGRRIYKSSSGGTSIYAYDGENVVEETNASGTAVARYSQGLNIDEPLAMLRGGATSFYHADGLGSVTSLSSSAGAISNTYTYDSFGNLTASTGSITNPFRYTAREWDAETGIYFYRARYMDALLGRFLNEDPLGFGGGKDFYLYVLNRPSSFVDPFGEKTCTIDVKCRGAHYGPLTVLKILTLGILRYDHCYIAVDDGSGTRILGGGPAKNDSHRMDTYDVPLDTTKENLKKDKSLPRNPDPDSSCKEGDPDDCTKVDCLRTFTKNYPIDNPVYNGTGSNSNTFIRLATESCGLSYPKPKHARGWDFKP
jgi:RHS repeat-associated protein